MAVVGLNKKAAQLCWVRIGKVVAWFRPHEQPLLLMHCLGLLMINVVGWVARTSMDEIHQSAWCEVV